MAGYEVGTLMAKVVPDATGFHAKLRKDIAKHAALKIKVVPDLDNFRSKLLSGLEKATAGVRIELPVSVDTSGVERELRAVTRSREVKVGADADTKAAEEALEKVSRDRKPTVKPETDTAPAEKKLSWLARVRRASVHVEVVGEKSILATARGVGSLSVALAGLSAKAGGAAMAVGGLAPAVAGVAAAASPAVASMGALTGALAVPAIAGAGMAFFTLKRAIQGVNEMISETDAEAFAEGLAEFPPAAQDAIIALRDLKTEWMGMGDIIQEAFWSNISNLGQLGVLMAPLQDAMKNLAVDLGNATASLVGFVTQGTGLTATKQLLSESSAATGNLGQALASVLQGLIAVGAAASPILTEMTRGMSDAADAWQQRMAASFADGSLQRYFRDAADAAGQLWHWLGQIGGIIGGVWSAMVAAGGGVLNVLGQAVERTNAWVNSAHGMSVMTGFFTDMQSAVGELMPVIGQLAEIIITQLAPIMADVATTLAPHLSTVLDNLSEVLTNLAPHIPAIADAFGQFAVAVSEVLAFVSKAAPVIGWLAPVLVPLIGTAMGVSFAFKTWSSTASVIKKVSGALKDADSPASKFAATLKKVARAFGNGLVKAVTFAGNALRIGFVAAVRAVDFALRGLIATFKGIGIAFRAVFKGIGVAFRSAVSWTKTVARMIGSSLVTALRLAGRAAMTLGRMFGNTLVRGLRLALFAVRGLMTGLRLLWAAMLANPVVAIIAAIVAVGVALWAFFTKTETGRRWWDNITNAMGAAWDWVSEKIGAGIDWISDKFSEFMGFLDNVKRGFEVLKTALSEGNFVETLAAAFGIEDNPIVNFFSQVEQGFTKMREIFNAEGMSGLISAWWEATKAAFNIVWQGLQEWIGGKWSEFTTWLGEMWNGFWGWLTGIWSSITGWFGETWSTFTTWLGEKWTGFTTWLGEMWNGFWGWLTGIWNGFTSWLGQVWSSFLDWLSQTWEGIKSKLSEVWESIKAKAAEVWNNILETAQSIWETIKNWLSQKWEQIKSSASRIFEAIKSAITRVWNAIRDHTSQAWEGIKNRISQAWDGIKNRISSAVAMIRQKMAEFVSAVQQKMSQAVSTIQQVPGKIRSAFAGAGSWLVSAGRNIMQGLANGISSMVGTVIGKIRDIGGKIKSAFTGLMGIHSPSRVFMAYGSFLAEGLAIGVDSNASQAEKSSKNLADRVDSSLSDALPTSKTFTPNVTPTVGKVKAPAVKTQSPTVGADGKGAATALGKEIQAARRTMIEPAAKGIASAVGSMGSAVAGAATGVAAPAVSRMASATASAGQSVRGTVAGMFAPAMRQVSADTTNTANTVNRQTSAVIAPAFAAAGQRIRATQQGAIDPAMRDTRNAVIQTANTFGPAASLIAAQWDRVRPATANPVRFTINTVFNDGLVGMWNSVSDLLGVKKMGRYPARFATGGYVSGPGGPTDDKIPALLSDGEYVIKASTVKQLGVGTLDKLNAGDKRFDGAFTGRQADTVASDANFHRVALRRQGGGIAEGTPAWKSLKRGYDWARSRNGRPYVWGGSAVGGSGADCSGFMSGIADVILGGNGMRQWATMNFPGTQQGAWKRGLAAGFSVGYFNGGPYGGHTAGTIGGVTGMPAVNVEAGGANSRVKFGTADAAGANHPQFTDRFHLAYVDGGGFIGSAGGGLSLADMVKAATESKRKKMVANAKAFPGGGMIGTLPEVTATKMLAGFDAKVKKLSEESGGGPIPGGSGVDRWAPMAKRALARVGFEPNDRNVQLMLAQIKSESGGNPGIAQQITDINGTGDSAGVGLLQIIPGTFAAYRDPALANNRRDPFANMVAALRYYKSRYGMDLGRMWGKGHGYDSGGWMEPGVSTVFNGFSKPEAVLTPSESEAFIGVARRFMEDGGAGAEYTGIKVENQFITDPRDIAWETQRGVKRALRQEAINV